MARKIDPDQTEQTWAKGRRGIPLAVSEVMVEPKSSILSEYSFLDQQDFLQKYANEDRMRFYIEGMSCGKCVGKIEGLGLTLEGLKKVQVDFRERIAEVQVDRQKLQFSRLAEEIKRLGFNPIPLEQESSAHQLRQAEDRRELIRLAIAGACAGNIMTFSFANYLGASQDFASVFSWLSFALYLPVVFYVALPFYRGAWASLIRKQIAIDLPMAVASLSGFVFSTVQLLRGREDIYFDSLSGFIFLILISRWSQGKLQRRFLRPEALSEALQLERVRKLTESGWVWARADRLLPGQRILISASETLPADAELISSSAHFSLAWLSGESRPKTFLRGAVVPAGARLVAGEAQLSVRKPLPETTFGKILNEVQTYSLGGNRISDLSDRWAQGLLAVVFTTAIAFLVIYWSVSPEESIRRALSLIILACPCAMAFGTPLALAAILRKARKKGLIVRNAAVFDSAARVETIFFDKTGTLTESDLTLVTPANQIPYVYQKVILALENESLHPIAFAFRRVLTSEQSLPPVDGAREIPGVGVSGFVYGKFYEIKKNAKPGSQVSCTLFEDHQPILDLFFASVLKPQSRSVLDRLRGRGIRVVLLSGDSQEVTESIGDQLGFKKGDVFSECCPTIKAEVASLKHSMMVGDGVNDSLAMIRADVGVAVSGGMETALKGADVYLTNPSLEGIDELIKISRQGMALIRRNLAISLIYNSIGGILALFGYINPFVAAVLMPISSGFILFSTWIEERSQ
jgi:Cu2+-exporting ATPase/Cu+-exporting ATPase